MSNFEKGLDIIRIVLLVGLVFFVFQQNKTIGQLETRLISLNNHIADIGEFVEGHEISHADKKPCEGCMKPMFEEEVGSIILELMANLITKLEETGELDE